MLLLAATNNAELFWFQFGIKCIILNFTLRFMYLHHGYSFSVVRMYFASDRNA